MSDDAGVVLSARRSPRKRAGDAQVADFTLLVRVPGQPAAVRAFTDDEAAEAVRYADETGEVVVPLLPSSPTGYVPSTAGSLIPAAESIDYAPPG